MAPEIDSENFTYRGHAVIISHWVDQSIFSARAEVAAGGEVLCTFVTSGHADNDTTLLRRLRRATQQWVDRKPE